MSGNKTHTNWFCRCTGKYKALGLNEGEGEGEVAFFSAKRLDRRNRADLIESATPCHDAQVVGPYRDSNPLLLTILAAMSEDYTTAPQQCTDLKTSGFIFSCTTQNQLVCA